ncbi:DNA gyrase subunit A [Verrucomicrobiales bacterium]|nr:DNA gyrase subunit A [Verrucomicrobiales bacterium]MDB2495553.1 DNA gyrase subunit A [Verrucomicrobiales bacterium]MDB3941394.1 DNA gyrase subunit A [Verrucomicrobiales bacterium]
MADDTPEVPPHNRDIEPISVADEMSNSFLDYSMSVIISRALPDARDGLKPSQRRILLAMNDLGLGPGKHYRKCAKICGDTSGNYHPHGEATIYPTLVNMAQPWTMREILVQGQGNFGSVEGDPPAAMRYTEARLTHVGHVLMTDMEKDTVDFVQNYDETRQEPVVFPAAVPNLLVNGGTGIAVGMATNIPPHNLGEVIDGVCATIDNPDITHEQLLQLIKGPDFPTGCTILGQKGIQDYSRTGRGSIRVRGRATVEETKTGREQIIITEIPYVVNRARLVERIAELANQKILPEISAVRDESDENTRVVVDLKRDSRAQVVLNNLYKHTALESSYSANMLAIDDRRPKLLSVKDALVCYIEHRREVILRRTRWLLAQAEKNAEKLEAYLLALGNLDDFIKMIRDSKTRDEAREKIKAYTFTPSEVEALGILLRDQPSLQIEEGRYVFTDTQVNHILELRLYQLVGLERDKIKADYDELIETIKDLLDIIAREERVLQIIKDELREIQEKWATPRKTDFAAYEGEIANVDLIANESNMITISHRGYIKRTLATEFRTQARGGKGLKGMETRVVADEDEEADFVEHLFAATSHDYLMFFTNTGRVYIERVFQIPEGSRIAKGRSIKNLLNLKPEESIASVLRIVAVGNEDKDATFVEDQFVLFATRSGKVKKTKLSDFRNFRKDGIIAIKIEEGNELIDVKMTNGADDISLVTSKGYAVRTSEENIRSMGRPSAGVAGIRPGEGDYLVSLAVVDNSEQLLVVSEKGLGKRTPFEDYPTKGRGGKGVITMKVTEKTGLVVKALRVSEDDEIMLMTDAGQSVRISAASARLTGRNAQGVILMKTKDGETIQDIARVVSDDVEDEEGEDASDVENSEADTASEE